MGLRKSFDANYANWHELDKQDWARFTTIRDDSLFLGGRF